MKTNTLLLSIAICFCSLFVKAQDLHYSNYNYAPLYLNPANTGSFNGNIIVGASYRDQSRTFIGEAYQSTMVYADSPVSFILTEKLWLGLGINLFADQVGDLGFGMSGAYGSAALHYSLDDDYTTVIGLGVQYGMIQRQISNAAAARWADELVAGASSSEDQNLLNNFNGSYGDLNMGINLKHRLSSSNTLEVGFSSMHINNPNFFFSGSQYTNTIQSRLNAYASIELQASNNFQITPAAYYTQYGNFKNIQLQVNTKTLLGGKGKKNKSKSPRLRSQSFLTLGMGYRFGDALQFFAGGIHKSWEFGLSYDLTTSSASNYNNTVGGLELGVKKYITIHTKPKLKVIQICPRV